MESLLSVPQGSFVLNRLPHRPNELLRAWDAADEYLLEHLAELEQPANCRVLIVNDTFGALAVALHHMQPTAMSDSFLSQQATRVNLNNNQIAESNVILLSSLAPLTGTFDWVLVKLPKTLALLEDQLIRMRAHVTPQTQIMFAGMIKAMPSSIWALVERLLGKTTTSLAKKKARLIFAEFNPDLPECLSPYPVSYQLEDTDFTIINHANVFSRDSLDIGTRFFISHLPEQTGTQNIVDLGCGNGVLGLIAARLNPQAKLHFVDESFMAVASAQENFKRAFADSRLAVFSVTDGLTSYAAQTVDLILCNPPFHQQNTIGDQLAVGMFKQSYQALRSGGELWVIGNRHLAYHAPLKKLFGNCAVVASNAKFVIFKSHKQT
jgi:16S rRNA (guanine1207-N2)-methyltransferase